MFLANKVYIVSIIYSNAVLEFMSLVKFFLFKFFTVVTHFYKNLAYFLIKQYSIIVLKDKQDYKILPMT